MQSPRAAAARHPNAPVRKYDTADAASGSELREKVTPIEALGLHRVKDGQLNQRKVYLPYEAVPKAPVLSKQPDTSQRHETGKPGRALPGIRERSGGRWPCRPSTRLHLRRRVADTRRPASVYDGRSLTPVNLCQSTTDRARHASGAVRRRLAEVDTRLPASVRDWAGLSSGR